MAVMLVIALVLSSLAFGITASATTNSNIEINKFYTNSITGADDKIWYTYTPSVSGKYAFVSYTQMNEAYLFTKANKMYNQIAYAGPSDPDYLKEGHFRYFTDSSGKQDEAKKHYSTTFYMECYLIKGTTYYFAAGYANEGSAIGSVNVALYNLEYDEENQKIASISVECPIVLSAYTDGQWSKDSIGESYYLYNYSKLIQNMKINILFKDGTTAQIDASSETYDGMRIAFEHNQSVEHWYPQKSDEYTRNTLTVKIGSVSCYYDVQIETSAMFASKGKVVDYATNEPIENAEIYLNNVKIATTSPNGVFVFTQPAGSYNITVKTESSIDYTYQFVVNSNNTSLNNQTSNPIRLINYDYVKDGIINAKDYAFAKKNGYVFNSSVTNFTKANY